MPELYRRRVAELYVTKLLTDQQNFAGLDVQTFRVQNGSRIVFYLDISEITGTLNLSINNASVPTQDFLERYNQNFTTVGITTIPLTDIQKFFSLSISVTGSASYSLGVTLADNSSSELVETELQQLNETAEAILAELQGSDPDSVTVNLYEEANSVASGDTVDVVVYTVPADMSFLLQFVEYGGNNIATYEVSVDDVIIAKKRVWFNGNMSDEFLFTNASNSGINLVAGQVVKLRVNNFRPSIGNFEGRILGRLESL